MTNGLEDGKMDLSKGQKNTFKGVTSMKQEMIKIVEEMIARGYDLMQHKTAENFVNYYVEAGCGIDFFKEIRDGFYSSKGIA